MCTATIPNAEAIMFVNKDWEMGFYKCYEDQDTPYLSEITHLSPETLLFKWVEVFAEPLLQKGGRGFQRFWNHGGTT